MSEIPKLPVYVVDAGNPHALSAVRKLCDGQLRPGEVVLLTAEEFKAMQKSVIQLAIDHV